jgi:rhodanese-related sulfurtransferase
MTKYISIIFTTVVLLFNSCTSGQSTPSDNSSVSAAEFSKKIAELPDAPLIDVRTPGEFSQSHLKNAVNYDISTNEFVNQIASLDKSKPVLIYC